MKVLKVVQLTTEEREHLKRLTAQVAEAEAAREWAQKALQETQDALRAKYGMAAAPRGRYRVSSSTTAGLTEWLGDVRPYSVFADDGSLVEMES